jgi:hypothetical protein
VGWNLRFYGRDAIDFESTIIIPQIEELSLRQGVYYELVNLTT